MIQMYVLVKRWLALIDWGCMSEDDCCVVFRLDSENDRFVFQVGLLVLSLWSSLGLILGCTAAGGKVDGVESKMYIYIF